MIPEVLEEWTINTLTDLLTKGYFESEEFDFKEHLPHNNDESGKLRLVKTCCAFANSGGGFLIFGVSNNGSVPLQDRLVGLDPNFDFPEHFGSYPQKCMPNVAWDFKNPPISLENGKVMSNTSPCCYVYYSRYWTGVGYNYERGFGVFQSTNGSVISVGRTNEKDDPPDMVLQMTGSAGSDPELALVDYTITPGLAGQHLLVDPEGKPVKKVDIHINSFQSGRRRELFISSEYPITWYGGAFNEEKPDRDVLYTFRDRTLRVGKAFPFADWSAFMTKPYQIHLINTIDALIPGSTSPIPQAERRASTETPASKALPPARRTRPPGR